MKKWGEMEAWEKRQVFGYIVLAIAFIAKVASVYFYWKNGHPNN